jgi:hypothetical protein
VLVALALLVFLAGATTAFLRDLQSGRRVLMDVNTDLQSGSIVMDRLERDLATCVTGHGGTGGVVGNATSIKVLSRALMPGVVEAGDALRDLQATSLTWDERTGALAITRYLPGASGSSTEELSRRVERLRLRYHDGTDWRESFDSGSAKKLPVAVEVAIWFAPAGRDPVLAPVELDLDEGALDEPGVPVSLDDLDAMFGDEEVGLPVDERVWGAPDRLRVIAVPDASVDAGEGRVQ